MQRGNRREGRELAAETRRRAGSNGEHEGMKERSWDRLGVVRTPSEKTTVVSERRTEPCVTRPWRTVRVLVLDFCHTAIAIEQ
jgi:hypothetical protein